jgi:hypothetical protein
MFYFQKSFKDHFNNYFLNESICENNFLFDRVTAFFRKSISKEQPKENQVDRLLVIQPIVGIIPLKKV